MPSKVRLCERPNGNSVVMSDFGASGVPETFVIDREGKIRHQHIGPLTADDIDHEILPLIEELSK